MLIGGKGFAPKKASAKCDYLKVGGDGSLLIKDPSQGCQHYKLEFREMANGSQITACQHAELKDGAVVCIRAKF